jgi:EAL and modified HD-GYP domain-containing signal transduction protein
MQAYHFFSPLLAPNKAWAAFDWQTFPALATELSTLSEAIDHCTPLAARLPLWVPCKAEWLHQPGFREFIKKIDRNQTILAFPHEAATTKPYESACQSLRKDGHHTALHVADSSVLRLLSVASFDHVAFDAGLARERTPLIDLINAHQFGFQIAAREVRTHEMFDWTVAKRFSLMSSHFVSTVDVRAPVDADTTRLKLLKLLSLVVKDADTREIEEVFREEPKLSYNLLRLVNSVAVGPKTPITGFNQAITVLGRRQLQRWLQLLIYANQFGQAGQPNPLMQAAAARGKQLELLAAVAGPIDGMDDVAEAAFMTGIFSLLDTLLHLPMSEVLATVPLADPIVAALSRHEGKLGGLLAVIVDGAEGAHERAVARLMELGISTEQHLAAQANAFTWASKITLE